MSFNLEDKTKYAQQDKSGDTVAFKELKKEDGEHHLIHELEKLHLLAAKDTEKFELEFDGYQKLFHQYLHRTGPSLQWEKIQPPPLEAVKDYASLTKPNASSIREMLSKLVVVKLNGGLGTSMGCIGPKCIIPVKNNLTFLDMTVEQLEYLNNKYDSNVPLVLMNSFNTDEDTQNVLRKYRVFRTKIHTFTQSKYPRINKESMIPIAYSLDKDDPAAWYPPGHGNFYETFYKSGLCETFLNEGREFCFISNIDNLGATVDINILNSLINPISQPSPEFLMEVTNKTNADIKGGTLIQYEGKLRLLEIAQVAADHVEEFKSIKKFKIFNTNNLWIKLEGIARLVKTGRLDMEIIVNLKLLDSGFTVIQLETAAGAAIKNFNGAKGINVPRSRFLPVKKISDLLLVKSNLYTAQNGYLTMNPQRSFATVPSVKLGDNHFSKVAEFSSRFASVPDLLELDHLTVSGDVTFGKDITLKGTVIIIANNGDKIDIPPGSTLENKVVSGNLRISDY